MSVMRENPFDPETPIPAARSTGNYTPSPEEYQSTFPVKIFWEKGQRKNSLIDR
jgi:hypothetical protein